MSQKGRRPHDCLFYCNLPDMQSVLVRVCVHLECKFYVSSPLPKQEVLWIHCNSRTVTEFCFVRTGQNPLLLGFWITSCTTQL